MLQNAYLLAKIGVDRAENERNSGAEEKGPALRAALQGVRDQAIVFVGMKRTAGQVAAVVFARFQ